MNYRHAFHAGNHADVLKHWVLTRVLAHLQRKATPFRAIDTHAGLGFYDLAADEAGRTGEWHDGIGRLDAPFADDVEALLAPYREAVAAVRARHGDTVYPGSPALP
ncbi:MAG: 23S rRNA (adenine(2030)-N(6))-methyltransferase RlmJ, partial [Actinomycetospora chiangmaiensis]|nr:23S rRNA (adenine(2030)-N(6))-methyltransferase RlmJ [Actinomycetospora chiangmaiensis]